MPHCIWMGETQRNHSLCTSTQHKFANTFSQKKKIAYTFFKIYHPLQFQLPQLIPLQKELYFSGTSKILIFGNFVGFSNLYPFGYGPANEASLVKKTS